MATFPDNLSTILSAVFGEDMRQAIHDAVEQAYNRVATSAVRYDVSQSLSDTQKQQARDNIGATTGAVRYDVSQSLSDTQKHRARINIDAPSSAVILDLNSDIDGINSDIDGINSNINAINDRLADLEYEPVSIKSFVFSAPANGQALKGSTVSHVSLHWTINNYDASVIIVIDGESIVVLGNEYEINDPVTIDTAYTLRVSDSGSPSHPEGSEDEKTITLRFINYAYYGVAAEPASIDSTFVEGLANRTLASSRVRTFTITAGSGQYIWYAVPTGLGQCSFNVGGFEGGFESPATVSVTNSAGYTESYYVYRSTNPSLGQTTVVVL